MKGFYHIWAWRPSWSCDLDFLYTHWFPLPIDASYKIWLWLAKRFQRRRSLKLWMDGRTDGRTDDGRTTDHGHPISSPCEPNGSGELKKICLLHGQVFVVQSNLPLCALSKFIETGLKVNQRACGPINAQLKPVIVFQLKHIASVRGKHS